MAQRVAAYQGGVDAAGAAHVIRPDGSPLELAASLGLRNHSPQQAGISWYQRHLSLTFFPAPHGPRDRIWKRRLDCHRRNL